MKYWSEKNGSKDVIVHGFSPIDNLIVIIGGLVVLGASIFVIAGLS